MRDIHLARVMHAPREAVWAALTDADALAEWLMPNDFAPRLGHRFTFRTRPAPGFDGIVHSEVLALDAPRLLVLAWRGGPLDTTLRFELQDHPEGTLLTLRHDGFRGLGNLLPRIVLGLGWRRLLERKLGDCIARRHHGR